MNYRSISRVVLTVRTYPVSTYKHTYTNIQTQHAHQQIPLKVIPIQHIWWEYRYITAVTSYFLFCKLIFLFGDCLIVSFILMSEKTQSGGIIV